MKRGLERCGCSNPKPCGCNENQEDPNVIIECGCRDIVDFLCTIYSGEKLEPLNITPGLNGNQVIKIINDYIKNVLENMEPNPLFLKNVGEGVPVYKGMNELEFVHEFKKLAEGVGIKITEQGDSIVLSINPDIIPESSKVNLVNVGQGVDVYHDTDSTAENKIIRRFSDTSSIKHAINGGDSVVAYVDKDWLNDNAVSDIQSNTLDVEKNAGTFDIEINTENAGAKGIPIHEFFSAGKVHRFPKVFSKEGTINIEQQPDGSVSFDVPKFDYIKSFYVNATYPGNDGDGSIIRPFKTFDDAVVAYKGSGGIENPDNKGAKIIIQSDTYTSVNPSINGLTLELQNNSIFQYMGNAEYMFDTELIYPLIPKGSLGELTSEIIIIVIGNGSIQRSGGKGIVRSLGKARNVNILASHPNSQIIFGDSQSNLRASELDDSTGLFVEDVVYQDGRTFESVYGYPFKATTSNTLNPTTPLFYAKYSNKNNAPTLRIAGKSTIETISQTNISLGDDAQLWVTGELNLDINGARVVYDGTFAGSYSVFKVYRPKANRNMIELGKNTYFNGKINIDRVTGFGHTGWDSLLKMDVGATIDVLDADIYMQDYCAQIINANRDLTYINLGNGRTNIWYVPNADYFVNGNNNPTGLSIQMPSTNVTSRNILKNLNSFGITTLGRMASINSKPYLTGYISATNNSDAISKGAIRGEMYMNTTSNSLTIVY